MLAITHAILDPSPSRPKHIGKLRADLADVSHPFSAAQ
jgi:hypothetical protein